VSRPWNRRVRLCLEPSQVKAALDGGWRSRNLAKALRSVDLSSRSSPPSDASAAEAISAVLAELEQAAALRGAPLYVRIDDALTHLDVVPGDFRSNSHHELNRIAHACVTELLGADAASTHCVRWTLQPGERHLVVCALPEALRQAVVAAANVRGLVVKSLQPAFCGRWNARAGDIGQDGAVFVSTSSGQAVIACVEGRAITALSTGVWAAEEHDSDDGTAVAMALLDAHVDRIVASRGTDSGSIAEFRLVTPEAARVRAPARWTVLAPPGVVG
jgi:hypothetical protein